MDLPLEPEEPTSIIRIVQDFDNFTKAARSSRRLDRSGKIFGIDSSCSQSLSRSVSQPARDKQRDIELLATKAKLISVEKQLKCIETERKREKIDLEVSALGKRRKVEKPNDEKEELQKQLKYLLEKEESAREEAKSLAKKLGKLQDQYKKDGDELKRSNSTYTKEIDEMKENHRQEMNELVNRVDQNEIILYKNKAEENEIQLALLKSKLSRYQNVTKENEGLLTQLRDAEYKLRMAEERVARQEEAFVVAKAMQEDITKVSSLKKENEKYKEENQLLRETRGNVVLLTNKYEAMKRKYEVAVEKNHSVAVLETENEILKKKMKRWEVEDTTSGIMQSRSPMELSRMVSELQKSQLTKMEKQGELQASVSILESSLQKLKGKHGELKDQYLELEEKERQQAEKCQRLQRRLLLVTADRDGIRRILNNFDTGVASVQSNQMRARVEEAEHQLAAANELIDKMEKEAGGLKNELSSRRLQAAKLQSELNDLKCCSSLEEKAVENVDSLKSEIDGLKKTNTNLQEQVDTLEARIEQRHLQGDFDPTKTKVLHFAGNPLALSRKLHAQQLDYLRDENEDLRRKVKALEQRSADTSSLAQSFQGGSQSEDGKSVQELQSRLESSELQNKRLKEVFTNTVQDFRESCYQLFGYKNDMIGPKKFKLLSMYAERPDDHFIFQMTPEHQMEMIETDFSHRYRDAIDTYLHRGRSIPAFLGSISLDLFSRQTQIIDSSLFKVEQKR